MSFCCFAKEACSDPRDLHRIDDDALRNAEYRRRWPPGDDPLAREAGALRCAPACGLVRALTHAERLAGPEAARSVIGRYARTTLVWKAQARALSKVRTLAGACPHAACPDARLTAPRAPEQDSGEQGAGARLRRATRRRASSRSSPRSCARTSSWWRSCRPRCACPVAAQGRVEAEPGGYSCPHACVRTRRQVWRFDPRVRMRQLQLARRAVRGLDHDVTPCGKYK